MQDDYNKSSVSSEDSSEITENSYYAYLNEVLQYKVLSRDEELSLFLKIQNGDDVAKDLFIKSNLRLVIKVAKKYYKPGYNQLLDLIQDGNIGLLQAVNLFDPSKGCKFSTYAVYRIHKSIQSSSCRTGLPLELPQAILSLVGKIRSVRECWENENGIPPSTDELAAYLGESTDKIERLMPFVYSTVSLNSKIQGDESEKEYIDVFSSYYGNETSEVESSFIIKETREEFRNILNEVLSQREFYVLAHRQGLFGCSVKSVKDLAEELQISQQGVRQTEERCIVKLRKHLYSIDKSLADFIT